MAMKLSQGELHLSPSLNLGKERCVKLASPDNIANQAIVPTKSSQISPNTTKNKKSRKST